MSSRQDISVAWPGKIAVGESVQRPHYEAPMPNRAACVFRRRRAWLDGGWRLFVGIAKVGFLQKRTARKTATNTSIYALSQPLLS